MNDPIRIYLAATRYEDEEDKKWKLIFQDYLTKNKNPDIEIVLYDPDPKPGAGYDVIPRDKLVIENSQFIVAYIQKPSFGTIMEIKHSFDQRNIAIYAINPNGKYQGNLWLSYHLHKYFTDVEICAQEVLTTIDRMRVISV